MYSKSSYIGVSTTPGPRSDADVEVEFVFDEVEVAVPGHAEQFARDLEVLGVDHAVRDVKLARCLFCDAVTGAGNDRGSNEPESGPKTGMAKTSPFETLILPLPPCARVIAGQPLKS